MRPRATVLVAAAAVLALVSPGTWGAWQGAGTRDASLASARLGYSLSGAHVGGGGYSWSVVLSLLGSATDHFSVTNTGSVPETIKATVSATGLNLGSVTLYGCPNTFTGITCTGRVDLGNAPGTKTLVASLAPGATYNIAVRATGILGLALTVSMPADTFVITHRNGADRTTG